VDVAPVLDGADLNPRDELDAVRARGLTRGIDAGRRVVIGDADNGKARSAGLENKVRRRERAVGRGCV
jgi:hypothetical protein